MHQSKAKRNKKDLQFCSSKLRPQIIYFHYSLTFCVQDKSSTQNIFNFTDNGKKWFLKIAYYYVVKYCFVLYVSQGFEEIRHFRKSLGISGNAQAVGEILELPRQLQKLQAFPEMPRQLWKFYVETGFFKEKSFVFFQMLKIMGKCILSEENLN